jgi:DNA-binding CsgD family transcriptional regulator
MIDSEPPEPILDAVRRLMRLASSVRSSGATLSQARGTLCAELCRLLDADRAALWRIRRRGANDDVMVFTQHGFGHAVTPPLSLRPLHPACPVARQINLDLLAGAREIVHRRSALVDENVYRKMTFFEAVATPLGQWDSIQSLIRHEPNLDFTIMSVYRSTSPAFTQAAERLLLTVHSEMAWVLGDERSTPEALMHGLADPERETLDKLLKGRSEKEVAAELGRSVHTVHSYVKRIYRRLGVTSRAELLALFLNR